MNIFSIYLYDNSVKNSITIMARIDTDKSNLIFNHTHTCLIKNHDTICEQYKEYDRLANQSIQELTYLTSI